MTRRHPARTLLTGFCLLLAIDLAAGGLVVLWHALPVLTAGSLVAFAWLRARHRLPWQRTRRAFPSQGHGKPHLTVVPPDLSPEVARLRAENDQLRARLADARESAAAAWDAASDRPPRLARKVMTGVADLADQPFSGVRRLVSGDGQ